MVPDSPLLLLSDVNKIFSSDDGETQVLHDVSLRIDRGEMVAIIGASGSGKSSLMNILGCLDVPTTGSYKISGKETRELGTDELSALRRSHFGFIFQRYHLIPHLSAAENVEIPALYNGVPAKRRFERACQLLERLGLAGKENNRPSQLSGGQQQRVSICRALMNQADVILADEPTGALDKHSGQEVLTILKDLNHTGKTIIIITHDSQVAAAAERLITIEDGRIISDSGKKIAYRPHEIDSDKTQSTAGAKTDWSSTFNNVFRSIFSKPLRTFLTMLGIMIGIAAVVSIEAIGSGAKDAALEKVRALSTNTLYIYSGRAFSNEFDTITKRLDIYDVEALEREPYVDSITPVISQTVKIRTTNKETNASLQGVGIDYFRVRGFAIIEGRGLNKDDILNNRQSIVIDSKTRDHMFGKRPAIGERIVIKTQPGVVVGIAENKPGLFAAEDKTLRIWTTYSAGQARWFGSSYPFDQIIVRLKDNVRTKPAEKAVHKVMLRQHGAEDFSVYNADAVLKTTENISQTLALMMVAIGVVALIVGGIGVMNIMLVSVVERTQEIGIRMAVGARRSDIQQQFLLESVMLCLLGGVLGLIISQIVGILFISFIDKIEPKFSINTMITAFVCSSLTGVIFGILPARRAAKLHPAQSLTRE